MSKTEGLDLDNLTVMDLSWRTIMRITAEFLVTSLENLYSGTFSRGGPGCVYQGAHHTNPSPT